MAAVRNEFVCDGFIEVTLDYAAIGSFGDERIRLAPGTPVDAPCERAISADDERINTWPGEVAWECPRCGKANVRQVGPDDL